MPEAHYNRGTALQAIGRCDGGAYELPDCTASSSQTMPRPSSGSCMAQLPAIYMDEAEITGLS